MPNFQWEDCDPEQVNNGDYVKLVDLATNQPLEGTVINEPFVAEENNPGCREWIMTLRLHPSDGALRLVSTDRTVQVRRLPLTASQEADKPNFTASDGFEAKI